MVSVIVMASTSHDAWDKLERKEHFYTMYKAAREWPQTCICACLTF